MMIMYLIHTTNHSNYKLFVDLLESPQRLIGYATEHNLIDKEDAIKISVT